MNTLRVMKMTMIKIFQLMALGIAGLMLQACGIPDLTPKNEDTHLPASFKPGLLEQTNTGTVKWNDFFEDPNLLSLINTAVANNKEVNMMMQRISVAQNEIQARKGAYLPFVNFGSSAGGEKTGEFTRNGAVENDLQLPNGQAFPTFLGDYQFGLFSSWEIDVWKKLRNSAQVAVLEYMASSEGKNFLVTNLVAEVAHSYYELLALDNQLENLKQNISIQQNGLEMVKQLQLFARTTTLAVKRYEAEVAKNQSKKFEILQQITVTENRINFLLGRTPQSIQRASTGFMDIKPKVIKAGIPSQLLKTDLILGKRSLNYRQRN